VFSKGFAIVPPPLSEEYLEDEEVLPVVPVLRGWVRSLLVLMALAFCVVFGIAIWLNPYKEDGEARTMETHRQLGLPECTFKEVTGRPCPSCGMTTSFALFIRGDIVNSMRANWVGTILATCCFVMVPWALASAFRARYYWILSLEWFIPRFIVVFFFLMLLRWGIVLLTY
jgi:Protein of unknown function (DUF2752)